MDHRVTFPDFSAFQIDIPHGSWPHESTGRDAGHSNPDLYSAFWPEYQARNEPEAVFGQAAED
ncbi:hypothetical protein [Paenarthrobacter aurescens]|uniref:Uncharacterized protein n=1 Tax=Paenarthrobacter aurescens TaxID=43663 RepID=A0A4Y3NBM2_PAEAU|nr:hypothetical protein [Paenarthrobacter aurescens]UKA50136.1 hypothetical protein LFT48_00920 [Arthrobacter sp. FW305-123]MDO6141865.1 hypothetical protein [Paenarthrobacter aurescens]MDO6145670.1 hypothetical protein [Paenarthrobacter aurescens]MDO6156914.1 hypothetical protein [Paenarthrobacter aurescens]MDO6160900.1 hypothetical protein [Paenarthrobacter aurescens]